MADPRKTSARRRAQRDPGRRLSAALVSRRPFLTAATRTGLRLAIVALLCGYGLDLSAQHEVENRSSMPPRAYGEQPVTDIEARAWRDDLRALVTALERIHPEPYHHVSEERFMAAVAELDASIPRLADHEILVSFARLLALVGDGHTSLPLYLAGGVDFRVLPYRLGVYEDGIWVEGADRAYEDLVGGRVVAFGGVPTDDALDRVTPLISRDNDHWISAIAPFLLNRIEVLHALDVASDLTGVELTVEVGGETVTQRIAPLPEPRAERHGLSFLPEYTGDWVDARAVAENPVPLYQRRFDELYWWEYLPDVDLLYVKWDQTQNRNAGPSALEKFQEAMEFARRQRPARTVVDLRNNTGGEGTLARPIVREIVRTREVDEDGRLFVVIGRRTFSAAQMMTSWLEQFSAATLVGEPSSARYNGYAGHEPARLPNSGVTVMISDAYYQMGTTPRDLRQQATPRIAAVPTFEDYRTNRDPALAAILGWEPDAFARDLLTALDDADPLRAEEVARAWAADPVNRFVTPDGALNALGYLWLREGRTEPAVAVFELNTRLHPDYANGWDSLGEVYVGAGRRDEAAAAFRRALSIEPNLASSRAWLHRLGAESR